MSFHVPEKFRITFGQLGSGPEIGNAGAFAIKLKNAQLVFAIASDALGWEHVSVSRKDRCATWGEMCQVKSIFWDAEDCVVQYHPPESDYVNQHPNCLHLWRPTSGGLIRPPSIFVGYTAHGH